MVGLRGWGRRWGRESLHENKVGQRVFILDTLFSLSPVKAVDRGVCFELVYSPAIKDSTMRRYTISNALNLMQVCKGKVWFPNFRVFFKSSSLFLLLTLLELFNWFLFLQAESSQGPETSYAMSRSPASSKEKHQRKKNARGGGMGKMCWNPLSSNKEFVVYLPWKEWSQ